MHACTHARTHVRTQPIDPSKKSHNFCQLQRWPRFNVLCLLFARLKVRLSLLSAEMSRHRDAINQSTNQPIHPSFNGWEEEWYHRENKLAYALVKNCLAPCALNGVRIKRENDFFHLTHLTHKAFGLTQLKKKRHSNENELLGSWSRESRYDWHWEEEKEDWEEMMLYGD